MNPEQKNERLRRKRDRVRVNSIINGEETRFRRARQLEVQVRKLLAAEEAEIAELLKRERKEA